MLPLSTAHGTTLSSDVVPQTPSRISVSPQNDLASQIISHNKTEESSNFIPPCESDIDQIRHFKQRVNGIDLPVGPNETLWTSELEMDKIKCTSTFEPPVTFVSN